MPRHVSCFICLRVSYLFGAVEGPRDTRTSSIFARAMNFFTDCMLVRAALDNTQQQLSDSLELCSAPASVSERLELGNTLATMSGIFPLC